MRLADRVAVACAMFLARVSGCRGRGSCSSSGAGVSVARAASSESAGAPRRSVPEASAGASSSGASATGSVASPYCRPRRDPRRRRDRCRRLPPARSASSVRVRTRTEARTIRTRQVRAWLRGGCAESSLWYPSSTPQLVLCCFDDLWTGPTPYGGVRGPLNHKVSPSTGGHHRANGPTSVRTYGVVRSEGSDCG